MIQQMLVIWSLVPLPFLNPSWTSGSSWYMYCWSMAWRSLSIEYRKFEAWIQEFSEEDGTVHDGCLAWQTDPWVAKVQTTQDGRVEGCVLIFSCENSKITTHCWTTIDRTMLGSTKKDTPCPRAKEKPQQDGRTGKIMFRIKPHACHRCLEGTNKTLCTSGDPTETEPDLLLSVWVTPVEVWVSSGLPQKQGLWVQQTWVWYKPSWRRSPLTPP